MAEPDANAAAAAAGPDNGQLPPPRRRRRRWRIVAAVVVAVLGGLAAFVIYGPQLIARYVANTVLTGLDIDVEGVKTLRIKPLQGLISLGPVRFRPLGAVEPASPEGAGQLGDIVVQLSLENLWERNALIKSAAIGGIDIVISREADGQIVINGIPLQRILAEEAADKPPPEKKDKGSWGTGVDLLTVRDSRLVFRDAGRGTLEIDVSWLELDGFRSWEPDQPGTFTLIGDANGMRIIAWGQAQPFADNVRLRVETTIDEIAVPKIEAFAGPLPLTARDGTGRIGLRSRAALFADGRLEVTAIGGLDIADANLAGDGWRFAAKAGRLGLDLAFDGETYASGAITGSVDLSLADVRSGGGTGVSVDAADVKLNIAPIGLSLDAGGGLSGEATIATAVQAFAVGAGGGVSVKTASLDVAARPLSFAFAAGGDGRVGGGIEVGLADTRVDAGGGTVIAAAKLFSKLADAGFDLAADGGVSGQATLSTAAKALAVNGADGLAVKLASLDLAGPPMSLSVDKGGAAKLSAAPKLSLAEIAVKGPLDASVAAVDLALDPLTVEAGARTTVRTAGKLSARAGAVTGKEVKASLADLGIALANIVIEAGGEQTRINGDIKASIGTPQVNLAVQQPAGGKRARPEDLRIDARSFAVDAAPFAVSLAPAATAIEGKAGVRLEDARVKLPAAAGGPADITLARLGIGLDRAKGRLGGAGSDASGNLTIDLAGGSAKLGMVHRDARAGFGTFSLAFAPIEAHEDGKGWRAEGKGRLALDKTTAHLPESEIGPLDSDLGSLAITIAKAAAAGRGETLDWRIAADLALREIVAKVEGGRIADVRAERLTIDGISGDEKLQFAADRVGLGPLRAMLAVPKSATSPRPVKEATEFVVETREEIVRADAEQQGGATFRMDRFRLDGPSKVRVSDPNVEPPLRAEIVVNRLDVDNLDTGETKTKTDIELAATVNEFGKIAASGWLTPFADPPDFDLRAEVRGLQLPPFSGYAAQAVGVNIDAGRLRTDVKGAATAGQLAGQVDLTLSDLAFGALSKEQAARASAAIGVPIETAIGLLQDSEGKITLSLPVAGDLKSPSFDISGVIAKAVTGAVTSAVMAPFKLAFAPVSLIAGAVASGSAPALTPIPFAAGSAELDPQADGIVRGLVQVLMERQGLKLKVCGRAVPADLQAVLADLPDRAKLTTDEMLERAKADAQRLAEERTLAVRRAIVEGGAVKPGRIGECRATFDAGDGGPPRAEIGL